MYNNPKSKKIKSSTKQLKDFMSKLNINFQKSKPKKNKSLKLKLKHEGSKSRLSSKNSRESSKSRSNSRYNSKQRKVYHKNDIKFMSRKSSYARKLGEQIKQLFNGTQTTRNINRVRLAQTDHFPLEHLVMKTDFSNPETTCEELTDTDL